MKNTTRSNCCALTNDLCYPFPGIPFPSLIGDDRIILTILILLIPSYILLFFRILAGTPFLFSLRLDANFFPAQSPQ